MSCKGQFVAKLIAFAATSLGAAKVRAHAILIPEFADQEQENKMQGLQEPQLLRICRQFDKIVTDDRFNLVIWASINTVQLYQGLVS